uniref:Cofilin 1 (non-muscle), like n=3 Tax=Gasterosteus aculeatus TaxID=69293 RepID=G3NLQ5_GASAC
MVTIILTTGKLDMTSGVKVCDDVKNIITKMKVVKSDDAEEDRIRLLILVIDTGEIKIEKCLLQKDVEGEADVFKLVVSLMKPEKCCYLLYDCHFETKESSRKEELVFMLWASDTAKIGEKMIYASSKSSLNNLLDGVKHRLQINDIADMDRADFAKRLGNVVKLEGNSV